MEPSGSSAPEAQPLVETKKRGGSRALLVILVAIIVVLAGALAYTTLKLLTPPPTAPGGTFSVQSAQPTGVQGQPLRFVVSNLKQGAKARVHFGDGQILETSDSTFNYSYSVPGNYLVWVQQFFPSNGTVVSDLAASLFKVTIVPDIPFELSQFVSVPTIYFNTTRNPTAPIVAPNTPVYVYGNYTEISQLFSKMTSHHNKTTNITVNETLAVAVDHYVWDFGNGQTMTVTADPSTSYPVTNPIPVSYPASGSYAATLTLVTAETLTSEIHNLTSNITFTNTDTINTFSITVGTTVAVGAFAIVKLRNVVPSPGVITELVNSPGGPFSFDPQIDYETTGFEVVVNTQATLIFYNANSTTDWFPYLASEIPTVANGGISGNFTIYKFHLRPDVAFSNGDPITGYDVWYSTIRAMLFAGGRPGTADWIITQYLIPRTFYTQFGRLVNATNKAAAFTAILNGVSFDNATNTVTFHLVNPTPPSLFLTAVSDPLGMGILDAAWLESANAGITFTPDGFLAYQDQAKEGNYNTLIQFQPVASGPYQINTYVPSTAVVLTPNPHFPGIPNIPKQNNTIVVEWVSSPAVAYQLYVSGQGDIVTLLPPPYYKALQPLVTAGQTQIYGPFPSIT